MRRTPNLLALTAALVATALPFTVFAATDSASDTATARPGVSVRLVDTRPGATTADGRDAGGGTVAAGSTTVVSVAGRGVDQGAAAVALNVAVARPSAGGYLTVFPCGVGRPGTSNLNFSAGGVASNAAMVELGSDGSVCVYSSAKTHLLIDVTGSFRAEAFSADVPLRVMDSRSSGQTIDGREAGGGTVAAGSTTVVSVAGRGTDAGAAGVSLNVAVTRPSADGYLTVFPCGVGRPGTSNLNFSAGGVASNAAMVELGSDGSVCVYSSARANLVVDVTGSFRADAFSADVPLRMMDSRSTGETVDGRDAGGGTVAAGSTTVVSIAGRGVDQGAAAVALNVAVARPSAGGYLTVFPCGLDRPGTSNLNFSAGGVASNAAIVELGSNGSVCVYSSAQTHLIVDAVGGIDESGFLSITAPPPATPSAPSGGNGKDRPSTCRPFQVEGARDPRTSSSDPLSTRRTAILMASVRSESTAGTRT